MTTLEVVGLSAGYGTTRVLHDISVTFPSGELTTIVGPNGAGKSTLLNAIAGLANVTSGDVRLGGESLRDCPSHEIIERGIVLVPERGHLFPTMTVEENLLLGAYSKRTRTGAADRMGVVFDVFPRLRERAGQLTSSLSGGEQQMCALARALMGDPKVLLLDEPSLGLAPRIVEEFFDRISGLRGTGMTIVLLEQRIDAALSVANNAYVLRQGRVVLTDEASALVGSDRLREAYFGV